LCTAAVTVTTFLISGFLTYLGLLDCSKLSNLWELFKSGKNIRLRWDFCRSRIWKKCRIPAAAEIRYSPTLHMPVPMHYTS